MKKDIQGIHEGNEKRIAIVVSRFNEMITSKLLKGAIDQLMNRGVSSNNIQVIWVPGAWEIPLTAKKAALQLQPNAVICLGAVIKGETAHFEHVSNQASDGLTQVALETGIPIIAGVLSTYTKEQAEARCGIRGSNLGVEYADCALEMISVFEQVNQASVVQTIA